MSIAGIKSLMQCVNRLSDVSLARPTIITLGVVDHTRLTLQREFILERKQVGQSESTLKDHTKLNIRIKSVYKSTELPLIDRGHLSKIRENHDDFLLLGRGGLGRCGGVKPIQNLANLTINQPTREPVFQEFVGECLEVVMEDLVTASNLVDPITKT